MKYAHLFLIIKRLIKKQQHINEMYNTSVKCNTIVDYTSCISLLNVETSCICKTLTFYIDFST